jgi:hypothetical protein
MPRVATRIALANSVRFIFIGWVLFEGGKSEAVGSHDGLAADVGIAA